MWRIVEWSREKARGVIESDQDAGVRAERMVFDGAVALVDDFEVGELVHIEVEKVNEDHRVTRIWPDDPRFTLPPHSHRQTTPSLSRLAAGRAEEFLAKLRMRETYRIAGGRTNHELALIGDDEHIHPPPGDEIVVLGAKYVELAAWLEPKYIRLSKPAERDYLCGRVADLDEDDISLTFVDHEDRIYFIVARDFQYHDPRDRSVGERNGSA